VYKFSVILAVILIYACFIIPESTLYSQDDSFIESEMVKVQEEFQTDKTYPSEFITPQEETPLAQDEIVKELMKPGNENLLEQLKEQGKIDALKEIETKISEKKTEEQIKEENEKIEQQKKKEAEEEEKKIRTARASLDGLLFEDNYAYYQSIKDFYGYDIFLKFASKSKETGLLSNSNYVVGPGDELILTLWGDTEFQRTLRVGNDGAVYLKDVGVISLHGYKLGDLNNILKKTLSKRYNTIDPPGGRPTTFFDITLSKLKSINVHVNGEVVVPGSYNLSAYSTALDALKEAKGVTAKGTLRNIIILREGKILTELDIYDYLMTGKNVSDINLKNGDNIFVGPRLNTIQLNGEVLKPLKYEIKDNETLSDLIKFSGGLLPTAGIDRVKIERLLPFEQRTNPVVSTKIYDLEFTRIGNDGKVEIQPIKLYSHDNVTVFSIPRLLSDYVAIGGAVYRKGRYAYTKDMTINDLLLKCGGVLSDAFLHRVELIRTKPNASTEFVSLDLENGDVNFNLNQKDSIFIHSEWNLKSKKVVSISGYIARPGFYYLSDSTRISDLIFSKGGIEDDKQKNMTYMKRADLTRYNEDGLTTRIIPIDLNKVMAGDKSEDVFLEDRDQLRIYGIGVVFTEPKVKITGYVKYEGEYPLSKNMTVEDLVFKAHGFKEGAYKYKGVVFRLKKNRFETDSLSQVFDVELDSDFLETGIISEKKFFLQDNDHVVIRKHPDYEHLRKVTISGEVKFPGVYSLTYRDETLKDIIDRAGGLTHEAFLEGTVFQRDTTQIITDFKKATSSSRVKIVMKDKDDVHIPKRPGVVSVEGFVYRPQKLAYRNDWTLADYVEAAGGPIKSMEFEVGETVIYYPGGNAKVDGWLFSPDVKEGSKIIVERVQKEPDSKWREEVRSWLGIVTSTITILLLISKI